MNKPLLSLALGAVIGFVAACDEPRDFRDCSGVDITLAQTLPTHLSQTGLYEDIAAGLVSKQAVEFTPQFPLWTDAAKKRRWLLLPANAKVDTQNPADWQFPVGTKLFKEFVRDGVRVETRLTLRTESGWTGVAYVWDEDGSDAEAQMAAKNNVLGTAHDVPSAKQCLACHGGRRNFTLGFSATQLPLDKRVKLFSDGLLSHEPKLEIKLDPVVKEGLGFLHANCAHCHHAGRNAQPQSTTCFDPALPADEDFDFTLPANLSDALQSPAFKTGRGVLGTPGDSTVINRMKVRNQDLGRPSMPPLGTEVVDGEGVAKVEALLKSLANGVK
ncbi:MAG: hypothetical protein KC502_13905 [Myxococcales bacterium]|nr:hypothetical protein [Myxococcales bacterium]